MLLSLTEDSAISCCDLLCSEDAGELADVDSRGYGGATDAEFPADSDESMAWFIEEEADYSPGFDYPDRFRSKSLDPVARQESVAWILKVQAYYRFQPLTAYLAVNYMDRFLSSHHLPQHGWALQLLSVACLSLAAKMEETLVPSLLDLQVEGAKFIFEPRTVLRMELLVLTALGWKLRSVTPFNFVDFFACKIDPGGKYAACLVSWATKIILATMHDVDFLSHCPSALAAAAIICASDGIQDLCFINPRVAVSWCIGLTEEGIAKCYRVLQAAAVDRMPRKSHLILSLPLMDMGSSEASSSSSSPPTKRRKLNGNCRAVGNHKDGELEL